LVSSNFEPILFDELSNTCTSSTVNDVISCPGGFLVCKDNGFKKFTIGENPSLSDIVASGKFNTITKANNIYYLISSCSETGGKLLSCDDGSLNCVEIYANSGGYDWPKLLSGDTATDIEVVTISNNTSSETVIFVAKSGDDTKGIYAVYSVDYSYENGGSQPLKFCRRIVDEDIVELKHNLIDGKCVLYARTKDGNILVYDVDLS